MENGKQLALQLVRHFGKFITFFCNCQAKKTLEPAKLKKMVSMTVTGYVGFGSLYLKHTTTNLFWKNTEKVHPRVILVSTTTL